MAYFEIEDEEDNSIGEDTFESYRRYVKGLSFVESIRDGLPEIDCEDRESLKGAICLINKTMQLSRNEIQERFSLQDMFRNGNKTELEDYRGEFYLA